MKVTVVFIGGQYLQALFMFLTVARLQPSEPKAGAAAKVRSPTLKRVPRKPSMWNRPFRQLPRMPLPRKQRWNSTMNFPTRSNCPTIRTNLKKDVLASEIKQSINDYTGTKIKVDCDQFKAGFFF